MRQVTSMTLFAQSVLFVEIKLFHDVLEFVAVRHEP